MERVGLLMFIFIVVDFGSSIVILVKFFFIKNLFFYLFRVNLDLNNFCVLSYNARVFVGSVCFRRFVGKTNCYGETA